jgi:hypothetical protein
VGSFENEKEANEYDTGYKQISHVFILTSPFESAC